MIEADAAVDFVIPIPDGANLVEVSMPPAVMRAYQQAQQAHPKTANLPPMRIVKRGTLEHLNACLEGGIVYVKEDPLNPTILSEGHPLKGVLQSRVDSKKS